ncbi:MAG: heavy metal-associated domain-containing protein [Candidatus Shapirobacteria bacterium]|jgi:copper chaperone CopZ
MKTQTITLRVKSMHCPSCARLIEADLEKEPGVVAVNADMATKLVVVEFDPANCSERELRGIIQDMGYGVEP